MLLYLPMGCSFRLVFDRETGKPKGFGFCEYEDQETAARAMRLLTGRELNGRVLRIDSAASERGRDEPREYCKSRIFRMHVIFVYFVRGGFRTKIKDMRKLKSKPENLQRPATVRKFHAYERLESPGYEN